MKSEIISYPVTKGDKAFAKLWLSVIGGVTIFGIFAEGFSNLGLVACIVMFVIGVHYFNKTVWAVADEVLDCGNYLRVSKSGKSQDIPINEIQEIKLTYPNHKHLISIQTKQSGSIGKFITFRVAEGYPWLRSPNALVELKQRAKNV